MNLEKKFCEKYGQKEYERFFSKDFKEAVSNIDKIADIISKSTKEDRGK